MTVPGTPLKDTVPAPWVAPKLLPETVTAVPAVPEVGERLEIDGAGTTVKLTPLLFTPLANTTTFPFVAPVGTVATMLAALQLVTVAVVPLNLTVPKPCVEPKFEPAIVTDAPIAADGGDRLVILGAGTTVKVKPLLAVPLTVTITLPVVAPDGTLATMVLFPQLVTLAVTPLNFTVLLPCELPNPDPLIETEAPTAPDVGERLEMLSVANAEDAQQQKRRRSPVMPITLRVAEGWKYITRFIAPPPLGVHDETRATNTAVRPQRGLDCNRLDSVNGALYRVASIYMSSLFFDGTSTYNSTDMKNDRPKEHEDTNCGH